MKMWAGAIKCTVQCHVIVAWCPFLAAVNFSSHLLSLSFILYPSVLNMFLWHLFATNSVVVIVIFLLSASRPSDALPVDDLPPQRHPRPGRQKYKCEDLQPSPCICSDKFGLGDLHPIDPSKCGSSVLDFTTPRDRSAGLGLMSWASHPLLLHLTQ
jgi:hypothetical protein